MIRADDLRKVSISAADSIDIQDVDRVLGLIEVNLKEAASQGKLLYSANIDMMLPGISSSKKSRFEVERSWVFVWRVYERELNVVHCIMVNFR